MKRNRSNFTQQEIATIAKTIGSRMNMRINKCGNIDLEYQDDTFVHFLIYKQERGVVIRRRRMENWRHGTYINNNKPFASVKEAMKYFESYKDKCYGSTTKK